MAHNPEVEGSNSSPATKARGPFSNREMAFRLWFVNRSVHGAVSARLRKGSAPVRKTGAEQAAGDM